MTNMTITTSTILTQQPVIIPRGRALIVADLLSIVDRLLVAANEPKAAKAIRNIMANAPLEWELRRLLVAYKKLLPATMSPNQALDKLTVTLRMMNQYGLALKVSSVRHALLRKHLGATDAKVYYEGLRSMSYDAAMTRGSEAVEILAKKQLTFLQTMRESGDADWTIQKQSFEWWNILHNLTKLYQDQCEGNFYFCRCLVHLRRRSLDSVAKQLMDTNFGSNALHLQAQQNAVVQRTQDLVTDILSNWGSIRNLPTSSAT